MHVQRTVRIAAPAAAVWRCLTDAGLRRKWLTQLVSEEPDEPGRPGPGAAATVRLRQGGQVVTYRSTVIDWQPDRRLSVGMTGEKLGPGEVIGVMYDLAPGDGPNETVLDYHFQWPLKGFVLKLLSPLIRKGAGDQIERDLAGLKAVAESLSSPAEEG